MWEKLKEIAKEKIESVDNSELKNKLNEVKIKLEENGKNAIKTVSNKELHEKIINSINSNTAKFSGVIGAFLSDAEILKNLEKLTESAATAYDKALDSEYLKGLSGGGGNHRLFDNGHDIFSAWEKAKEALPDDKFSEEVIGYVSALWKDLTTTKGLPFTTISRETYDSLADTICGAIPGLNRKYLYDLLSFDAMEILSTGLGAVSVVFALKKQDQEKLAQILGSMGIISILSANPIMGIFVITTSAFAFQKKKMEFDKTAFTKSAIITTSSMSLFGILGMPILAELIIVGVATKLLKTKVLDNRQFQEILVNESKKIKSTILNMNIKEFINKLQDQKISK